MFVVLPLCYVYCRAFADKYYENANTTDSNFHPSEPVETSVPANETDSSNFSLFITGITWIVKIWQGEILKIGVHNNSSVGTIAGAQA